MISVAVTPMASRNLPPSFFNAHYHNGAHLKAASHYVGSGELYGGEAAAAAGYTGLHQLAAQHHAAASPDPWQYAAQVTIHSFSKKSPERNILLYVCCLLSLQLPTLSFLQ